MNDRTTILEVRDEQTGELRVRITAPADAVEPGREPTIIKHRAGEWADGASDERRD